MKIIQTIKDWFKTDSTVKCRWCKQKINELEALHTGWKFENDYWYCAIHK